MNVLNIIHLKFLFWIPSVGNSSKRWGSHVENEDSRPEDNLDDTILVRNFQTAASCFQRQGKYRLYKVQCWVEWLIYVMQNSIFQSESKWRLVIGIPRHFKASRRLEWYYYLTYPAQSSNKRRWSSCNKVSESPQIFPPTFGFKVSKKFG